MWDYKCYINNKSEIKQVVRDISNITYRNSFFGEEIGNHHIGITIDTKNKQFCTFTKRSWVDTEREAVKTLSLSQFYQLLKIKKRQRIG